MRPQYSPPAADSVHTMCTRLSNRNAYEFSLHFRMLQFLLRKSCGDDEDRSSRIRCHVLYHMCLIGLTVSVCQCVCDGFRDGLPRPARLNMIQAAWQMGLSSWALLLARCPKISSSLRLQALTWRWVFQCTTCDHFLSTDEYRYLLESVYVGMYIWCKNVDLAISKVRGFLMVFAFSKDGLMFELTRGTKHSIMFAKFEIPHARAPHIRMD